jgi:hypothetical protein
MSWVREHLKRLLRADVEVQQLHLLPEVHKHRRDNLQHLLPELSAEGADVEADEALRRRPFRPDRPHAFPMASQT